MRAVYIHPHWNPDVDQTGDSVFVRLAQSGISTVFVDVYYPTGIGQGVFTFERKGRWAGVGQGPVFLGSFSLDKAIEMARNHSISIHATVACFGELPAMDPSNQPHRTYLQEVVRFIVTQFPSIDGVHLDYLRYMHEFGMEANGNTRPITTLVKSIREIVQDKMLSAAVSAVGDEEEYGMTRRLMGQDFRELSEHLDFMCPMSYHLSAGKKLEWVGQVSRFMSRFLRWDCRIYPTIQAYYEFVTQITVSTKSAKPGKPTQALAFEVPLDGTLRFKAVWSGPKNRFSLEVREPSSQIVLPDRYDMHIRESTTESFTLRVRVKGSWTVELVTDLLSSNGDTVTVRVSDLN